jgi:GH15 family glucan-1,4-alpha-glucosidase
VRAAAGDPDEIQIVYGVAGERRLREWVVEWLPGFEDSHPVRVGNAAAEQEQLDVYGEVMDAMYQARRQNVGASLPAWELGRHVLGLLEQRWREPDEGIWEVRGGPRHFTHSKVMAWVAFDRGIKLCEEYGREGPLERWRDPGRDPRRGLPRGLERRDLLVHAVVRQLSVDGFLLRYQSEEGIDGLPAGEGTSLPCSFWLVDALALDGRCDEAAALFERLLSVCNDVGLLAEEYDPRTGRLLGNFPQAFSHIALVNSAIHLAQTETVQRERGQSMVGRRSAT